MCYGNVMKLLVLAMFFASIYCVVIPIYGQTTSKYSATHQKPSNGTQAPQQPTPPPQTINVDTVNVNKINVPQQTQPSGKPDDNRKESPSYFRRLIAPENVANFGLCIIGIIGIVTAICCLRTIEEQTGVLKDSVAVAEKNIDIVVSRERARVRILVNNIKLKSPGNNFITCTLANDGPTQAFIDDFRVRFINGSSADVVPNYGKCVQISSIKMVKAYEQVNEVSMILLEPEFTLTSDELISIKKGDSFLHFYGFVIYRQVLTNSKIRVNIHLRWKMKWGGIIHDDLGNMPIMEWWEPVGPPEENGETEEKA
jgi:hypothetical protein